MGIKECTTAPEDGSTKNDDGDDGDDICVKTYPCAQGTQHNRSYSSVNGKCTSYCCNGNQLVPGAAQCSAAPADGSNKNDDGDDYGNQNDPCDKYHCDQEHSSNMSNNGKCVTYCCGAKQLVPGAA